ncbi:hypothetical protein V8D89_002628 [Ganoderma adspersum]
MFRWDPNTLVAVIPTIRIANKHLVGWLHRYLVQKVEDGSPLTLQDWDGREAEIEIAARRHATYISGALLRPFSWRVAR